MALGLCLAVGEGRDGFGCELKLQGHGRAALVLDFWLRFADLPLFIIAGWVLSAMKSRGQIEDRLKEWCWRWRWKKWCGRQKGWFTGWSGLGIRRER